ncbi:restriction endonuclease subunit S [Corynebacterium tuberculostearicum]|uniref:restriction endonuclease subunit S n=1 Tax=Corynebacterium tuberculostearicum TaxID=38304 RepID=UPI0038D25A72
MTTIRLGEVAKIKHGFAFKSQYFTEEKSSYMLLTPGNFQPRGGYQPHKPKYFAGPIPTDFVLNPGELLLLMTDLSRGIDTLGSPLLVPSTSDYSLLHNQRIGKITNLSPEVNKTWLYYRLQLADYHDYIVGTSTGSTVHHTSPSTISEFSFEIPDLKAQKKIAKVLGALDDKIAANQLAIHKIQELLHAQWHAITNTGISSTEPISSIAEVNPRTSKPQSDECSFLEMKDLPEYGLIVDRWGKRETKGGTKFRNGDVLLARITPCFENGKMAIVDFLEDDEVGMGSTEYIVFRPKEGIPAAAIHAIIASPEFRGFGYKALTGTSGRQRIAADDLKEIAVPWPSESALTEYRKLTDALLKKATALRNENQVLARTRDELLPLLMSGRITVGEAEDAADKVTSES